MQSWEQLEQLFTHALELDENARTSFVQKVKLEDESLATRLEKMLNVAFETNNFMESLQGAMWQGLEDMNFPTLSPGFTLGKYTVDNLLGKGGMGQVYAGHRSDGEFDQKVAIKILGKYSALGLEEQRILGRLQHPNIAQIYDAGRIDADAAYIVMEYVEGLPIDLYATTHQLGLKERLQLFLQVCMAIQFSHQNLILHQDIKPANILVNTSGLVKILDFGIGKALDQQEANTSQRAATPYYASPEQLSGKPTGTSSDIFQLGILLYKLICDALPFESHFENDEITRIIDPRVVVNNVNFLPHPKLKSELKSIVAKCLNEHAKDRFASVEALSNDITSYLEGKAVDSYDTSGSYRFRKFVARNKISFAAAAIVLVAILSALVFSLNQAEIAKKERDKAQVTNDFLIELFASSNPFANKDIDFKEYTYLDFIKDRKQSVMNDQSLNADQKWEMLTILQKLFVNLTQWESALEAAQSMVELALENKREDWLAEGYLQMGSVYSQIYEFDKAEEAYEKLAPLLPKLEAKKSPLLVLYAKEIGLHYHLSGMYEEGEKYYKKSLEYGRLLKMMDSDEVIRVYGNYSQLLRSTGRFDSALLLSNQSIAIKLQKLEGDSMNVNMASSFGDRALIYMEDAEYDLSEHDFAQTILILEANPEILNQNYEFVMGNYVVLKNFKKEYEEAVVLARKLFQHVIEVYGEEDVSTAYAHLHLGESLTGLLELEEGFDELEKGKLLASKLLGDQHILNGIFHQLQAKNAILAENYTLARELASQSLVVLEKNLPKEHYRYQLSKLREAYAQWKLEQNEEVKLQILQLVEAFKQQGKRVTPYLGEVDQVLLAIK